MDTLQDPEFLADADKLKLEITPVPASEDRRTIDGALQNAAGNRAKGRGAV